MYNILTVDLSILKQLRFIPENEKCVHQKIETM